MKTSKRQPPSRSRIKPNVWPWTKTTKADESTLSEAARAAPRQDALQLYAVGRRLDYEGYQSITIFDTEYDAIEEFVLPPKEDINWHDTMIVGPFGKGDNVIREFSSHGTTNIDEWVAPSPARKAALNRVRDLAKRYRGIYDDG